MERMKHWRILNLENELHWPKDPLSGDYGKLQQDRYQSRHNIYTTWYISQQPTYEHPALCSTPDPPSDDVLSKNSNAELSTTLLQSH